MPLLDHFHAPVHPLHSWQTFHGRWAYALADALNGLLPRRRYLAEAEINVGPRIAADVAEFQLSGPEAEQGNGAAGGLAVQTWAPPVATATVPIFFPDDIEVQVFGLREGKQLVGVIELVSPANKDRPDHRRAFAAKCAAYLQRGIGLIVVDIVTERHPNLHGELLGMLEQGEAFGPPADAELYAVAYRPAQRGEASQLDLWPAALSLGGPLPLLPLALRGAFFVPVDLEGTYAEACQKCNL